jgi:hypothetical protein
VDQDVKSLAQFVITYISRNSRWNSPKFLIGESYGTFRSAALNYLQSRRTLFQRHRATSSVLDLGTISFNAAKTPYIFICPARGYGLVSQKARTGPTICLSSTKRESTHSQIMPMP